jgi:hypothetical protein
MARRVITCEGCGSSFGEETAKKEPLDMGFACRHWAWLWRRGVEESGTLSYTSKCWYPAGCLHVKNEVEA